MEDCWKQDTLNIPADMLYDSLINLVTWVSARH